MDSIFHIDTDIECKVLHYGKELCIATPGEDVCIELRKGRHRLTFISQENASDQYSIMYEVPENDIEDCIDVRLTPCRDSRLQKEAEERRIAYEAKQKRIREAKERETEELKRKQEAERKRREEEERRRREREEEENRRRSSEAEERRKEEEKRQLWADNAKRYLKFFSVKDEYSGYVIPSVPENDPKIKYLTRFSKLAPLPSRSPYLRYYSGRQSISANEPSVVFPVIKEKRDRFTFSEGDLIDFFARTAFLNIREFCVGDARDRFDYIQRHIKYVQDDLHSRAVRERGDRRGLILGPFLSSDEYQVVSEKALEGWIQSKMTAIWAKNGRTPYALCQSFLDAKTIPARSILAGQSRQGDDKARIDFFLYMVEKNPEWRDLLREMLHPDFWERCYYDGSFEKKILSIKGDAASELIECECNTYSVVYIDEACNEIIRVPEDYCAVSIVYKGIMEWYKRTENSDRYLLSCRDYRGSEIFNTVVDGGLLGSQIYPNNGQYETIRLQNEFRYPVGASIYVKEDGCLNQNAEFLLWASGTINDFSGYEVILQIKCTDFVFHGQSSSFSINNLPQSNRVGYKKGKYFLFSYQGVFEIQKPLEWDEELKQYLKRKEEWENRRGMSSQPTQ